MAINYKKMLADMEKKDKAAAKKWNKRNSAQKVTSSGAIQKPPTPKSNQKKRAPGQSRNPHKMSASAKKAQMKALTDYAFPRAMLGVWDGITSSVFGTKMTKNMAIDRKKLYKSKTYKAGNIGGQIASYGGGYGAAGKAAGKVATKAITSKTGKRIISKAAKKRLIQSAARKTLKKAGQNTTKKAVAHAANKTARDMAKGIVKNTVSDATVGTLMNSNIARSEGKKVGSKEWQKEMAFNAALDFGVGSAVELAPLLKGVGKGSRTVERIVDGKVKKVKVDSPIKRSVKVEPPVKSKKNTIKAPLPKKVSDARGFDIPFEPSKVEYDEAKVKEFDKLFEKEVQKHADYIRNYKKQGATYDFTPDRDRLEQSWEANSGFGYTTRHSDNDVWYQEAYKERGRAPNKSEAEEIARKNLMDDLFYSLNNPNYTGTTELGASDELKALYKELSGQSKPKEAIKVSNDTLKKLSEPEFENYIKGVFGQGQELFDYVQQSGKTFDSFIDDAYKDYVLSKDLGADVFRPSAQGVNEERFGVDRGVVNATPYGETSQTAKTMYNSDMLDDTAKAAIQQDINDGIYAKYTKKNATAIENYEKKVMKDGIETVRNDFDSIMRNEKMATSEDIITGYKLAEHYQAAGDYKSMMEVLSDVASMESEAGRTLQAMRIFNNLTPEGRVKSVVRQADKLGRQTGKKIEIPEELIRNLSNATDEATLNNTKKRIMTSIWNQIPANWEDKANAWRYLCMLGNPKTHIRNMLGNALFVPIKASRNIIAAGLERMLIRGDNAVRSKAILMPMDSDLVKAGAKDFDLVKDALSGSNRYFEGIRDLDARAFKNRAVEGLRRLNTNLFEKEDEIFMKYAYKRAYGQFLKANKVKNIAEASDDILRMARDYASKEALNSTYRDASALADWLASGKKYAKMPTNMIPGDTIAEKRIKKAGSTILEATIPFSKTPINIMRRGWDYSPGGLIQGAVKLLRSGGDNQKLMDGIAKFSSGLAGTGIVGLGSFMGFNDMARGALDTNTAEGSYLAQNGEQEYSIRVGDYTYTMDWAAPISMPFFVGVQLGNEFSGKGYKFEDVLSAMKSIVDPVFNLSMLSGLNNALDTMFGGNATLESLGNIGKSYVTQFILTISGQIAKTLTDEKRTTVSTAENADVAKGERFLNQIKNKIPYLTDQNEPYVDMWGKTEKKRTGEDYARAAFENFISPGTLKSTKKDDVDTELLRLAEETGDYSDIAPKKTDKSDYSQKFNDDEYRMTEEELTRYKKTRGQYAKEKLEKLFRTKKYQNASNADKKKAIKDIYTEAKEEARKEFLLSKGVTEEEYAVSNMGKTELKAYKKTDMSLERFEKLYKAKKRIKDSDGTTSTAMKLVSGGAENINEAQSMTSKQLSERGFRNARNLVNLGIKPKEVNKIAKGADVDGSGRLKTAELVSYLEGTNYTQREKAYIFAALGPWNARNPYY